MTSADSSGPVCVKQVLRVRHADSTRMVRPGDFDSRVVARHASLAELPERVRYVPLYADWRAERLVHGRWEGDAALSDVPFLYQHQRRHVQWLAELPFERLDAWHDDAGLTPTFVFSIGRCGSTLLSRLLAAAGEPAISEPDVLTNVAWVDDDAELAAARRWGRAWCAPPCAGSRSRAGARRSSSCARAATGRWTCFCRPSRRRVTSSCSASGTIGCAPPRARSANAARRWPSC